jgi:carbon storage regulator
MLILARKTNESIMIGDQIEISIVDIKGDQVKVGIQAPNDIKIYRQEVYKAIQMENIKAMETKPDILPKLDNLLSKKVEDKNKKDKE